MVRCVVAMVRCVVAMVRCEVAMVMMDKCLPIMICVRWCGCHGDGGVVAMVMVGFSEWTYVKWLSC